ncbi:MAG: ATP-dependent helicase [Anaerolineales bacterium]|nr:ATP-dependent helicase [Anaerolineales bacterium]
MTDSLPPPGISLSPAQRQIIEAPLNSKLFVLGPAGTGKTSAGVERMRHLLAQGVPGESILMLAAQRSVQEPYLDLLYSPERAAGGEVTSATLGGGLARRVCDLFWPVAGEAAGFAHPDQPPVFLSLETSQYYMAHIVRPLLDEGYFESVTMDRNRLYSQILDNLNKAAIVGFHYTEIASRLDAAYFGDPAQRRVYADAQDCAVRFREYCLQNNLIDFSLQLEIFTNILWPLDTVRGYLTRTYRHLIYDNVEEDSPRAHDIIRAWLPEFESALLIYDESGGYRHFLGSDPLTGQALNELCEEQIVLSDSFVMSETIASLASSLEQIILPYPSVPEPEAAGAEGVGIIAARFYPELLDAVVAQTKSLVEESGVLPADIVIISPFLSDALRFSVMNRLEAAGIPTRSHRPSRTLRDEPASQALLTLAALAHPEWNIHPPRFDVAYALMQSVAGLDLVRAQLLAEIVYRPRELRLSTFDEIDPGVQERITFVIGNRYAMLRDWLLAYREGEDLPFDHFLRKLFGEVLSQPGFGFHTDFDAVRVASSLVESVRHFRQSLEATVLFQTTDSRFPHLGKEYTQMLQDGVIAASYVEGWRSQNKDAVLVAPAHTFLMMNRPVTAQFWLDVGSSGWHQRLAQPLTHPYVLTREWEPGRIWTDADEVETSRQALRRVISGLLHRCRERVYLCMAELGESGFEQRGDLLRAFQRVLQTSGDTGG